MALTPFFLVTYKCADDRLYHAYAFVDERAIIGASAPTLVEAFHRLALQDLPDETTEVERLALEGYTKHIQAVARQAEIEGMEVGTV